MLLEVSRFSFEQFLLDVFGFFFFEYSIHPPFLNWLFRFINYLIVLMLFSKFFCFAMLIFLFFVVLVFFASVFLLIFVFLPMSLFLIPHPLFAFFYIVALVSQILKVRRYLFLFDSLRYTYGIVIIM